MSLPMMRRKRPKTRHRSVELVDFLHQSGVVMISPRHGLCGGRLGGGKESPWFTGVGGVVSRGSRLFVTSECVSEGEAFAPASGVAKGNDTELLTGASRSPGSITPAFDTGFPRGMAGVFTFVADGGSMS